MEDSQHFHAGELQAQRRWDTNIMWDKVRREQMLLPEIPIEYQPRIEQAPFFFLATSDKNGNCDCSFKGGGPGLIKISDSRHFAFFDYDGNGAFMSLGNLLENPHVGCLFIDFSDGARLRINGKASIHENDNITALFDDAKRAVLVTVEQVVPNCNAHVPVLLPGAKR